MNFTTKKKEIVYLNTIQQQQCLNRECFCAARQCSWHWAAITHADIDFINTFKPLESTVDLKGDSFFMGINDREGIHHEYPQRKANANAFK